MSAQAIRSSSDPYLSTLEGIESVRRKLTNIIDDFRRGWLRDFKIGASFSNDYIVIELKEPITIPFNIEYGYITRTALSVVLGKHRVYKITMRFAGYELGDVIFYYRQRPYDSIHFEIYGLAYFALPEIREAIKEAVIKSEKGHGGKWLKEYLRYLDEVSEQDISALRYEDLADPNKKVEELYVTAEDVAKDLKTVEFHLNETFMFMSVKTTKNRNIGVLYGFEDKTEKDVTASIDGEPADLRAVSTVLQRIIENDGLFNSVKRSILNYVVAYKRALMAYTLMNI